MKQKATSCFSKISCTIDFYNESGTFLSFDKVCNGSPVIQKSKKTSVKKNNFI